jgi:hypothetical protein
MVRSSIAPRPWTPEEEALLARLLHEGKDPRAIAEELNRTVASVQRRASDLRVYSNTVRTDRLTFADYLAGRRATYTQEWERLQDLKKDAAFREAQSWEDIERCLNIRKASLGLRDVARSVWTSYQQAKRRRVFAKPEAEP